MKPPEDKAVALDDESANNLRRFDIIQKQVLVDLGDSYLRVTELETQLREAKADLEKAYAAARRARREHGKMMQSIAHAMKLPAGTWVFDGETGMLVKKESSDA